MLLSDTNTLLSSHKANPVAHTNFLRHVHISSDCCMLLRQPLDRMPHTEKYAPCKPVMLVGIQNPLQQEPTSCKQSTCVSRMRWHLSEPYQQTCAGLQWNTDPAVEPPNNTAIFSSRTRSQDMFALVCHGKLSQYCCIWFAPRFFVFVFSFVIVLVLVRFTCRNFYFYIVFVFQIAIVLVFILTERSAIVLVFVFVFVTKIALEEMTYGVSNGHVTSSVTWPSKVLWGSTVGYPSDSLASC